ncbi:MAG: hypothetical protein JOZ07_06365 [Solirubrobacterales bacterium]|nr:hypothetical protein [Solirubrobacterales bacterium]
MYHLELRQFPHVQRVFNLGREELETRFLRPWVSGALIEHDDRRWAPERTRLIVLEGPEVDPAELGLGRGWGAITKAARDVTDEAIAQARRGAESRPAIEALKDVLQARAAAPIGFADAIALAAAAHPDWRASEQLSLAEEAVWELLHQDRVVLLSAGEPVAAAGWQPVLLRWSTWASGPGDPRLALRASEARDVVAGGE